MRSIVFAVALLCLAVAPASAGNVTFETVVSVISSDGSVSPTDGQQFIVGAAPSGAFATHEGKIAKYVVLVSPQWNFTTPAVGSLAYVSSTGDYYAYTGTAQLDGIYAGAKWRTLTPIVAKWRPGTKEHGFTASRADHGRWWWIAPDENITITLPSPNTSSTVQGVEFVAEVIDTGYSVTFELSGSGLIRRANGATTTSFVVEGGYKLLRLMAGIRDTHSTEDMWYELAP